MKEPVIRPKRVKGGKSFRFTQLDRDRAGQNAAYGVPQFLVRMVDMRRLKSRLTEEPLRHRRD